MKRERFYSVVIILLLLLNMGTLGYLWTNRKTQDIHIDRGGPHGPGPDRIIIDRLQLNNEQQDQFEDLKHVHRKSTDSLQELIRNTQHSLFALVKQDVMDTAKRNTLLMQIQQYESAKHMVTIQHFYDIRSILNDEQKQSFNEFMEDIGSRITGPGRGHHGPPSHY